MPEEQRLAVSLSVTQAWGLVRDAVLSSGSSVQCVAEYEQHGPGPQVVLLVFEKYFMRNSSRASLTVLIENVTGVTQVCVAPSGGGQGAFLRFDWGAGDKFATSATDALEGYRLR